jgi:hypothetical protein
MTTLTARGREMEGDDRHPGEVPVSQAAMIVPRALLGEAIDTGALTLIRRGRKLYLLRGEVLDLKDWLERQDIRKYGGINDGG